MVLPPPDLTGTSRPLLAVIPTSQTTTSIIQTPINGGDVQSHSIVPAGDEDWLRFSLSRQSAVNIETSGPENDDTVIYLYDNDLNMVDWDDDKIPGSDYFSEIDMPCKMATDTVAAARPGDYYIRVFEYGEQ